MIAFSNNILDIEQKRYENIGNGAQLIHNYGIRSLVGIGGIVCRQNKDTLEIQAPTTKIENATTGKGTLVRSDGKIKCISTNNLRIDTENESINLSMPKMLGKRGISVKTYEDNVEFAL